LFWNKSPQGSEHDWEVEAYKTLKSTLAFVLWEFSANNDGNPQFSGSTVDDMSSNGVIDFLPAEYYTTAVVCRPYTRFVVDARMFGLYIALQSLPVLFCWAVLFWRLTSLWRGINVSSFPLVDFMFKTRTVGDSITNIGSLMDVKDSGIIDSMKDVEIVVKKD
jgi:hypothetical protein